MNINRLNPAGFLPKKATKFSAGYDIYSSESLLVRPGSIRIARTGINIRFPSKDIFGCIYERSSLAIKGLICLGRVIDPDYNGELKIIVLNVSSEPIIIERGQRIAQIVLQKFIGENEERENEEHEGFGSTGRF